MQNRSRFLVLAIAALTLVFSLGFYFGKASAPGAVTVELQKKPQSEAETIPASDAPTASEPAPAREPASPDEQIDLNTATKEQLVTLPGVGEVLAERILSYREEVGRFVSTEQLMDVSGIGEQKYAALAELVKVEE